jgi:ATP-dependent Clp protease ATP-binding subunit ClpA
MGARPLARVIQEQIKKPLAEELLFGKLASGGLVRVKADKGRIVLEFAPADQPRLPPAKTPLLTAN